jgi:hypothetical protein
MHGHRTRGPLDLLAAITVLVTSTLSLTLVVATVAGG